MRTTKHLFSLTARGGWLIDNVPSYVLQNWQITDRRKTISNGRVACGGIHCAKCTQSDIIFARALTSKPDVLGLCWLSLDPSFEHRETYQEILACRFDSDLTHHIKAF